MLFVIAQVFLDHNWLYKKRKIRKQLKQNHCIYMCQNTQRQHEYFMRVALEMAKESFYQGEVPIGAVLVNAKGDMIAKGRNQVEVTKDPTQHAELQCIQSKLFVYLGMILIPVIEGTKVCGNWRLLNTTLYTTLEPCAMCLSALQLARVSLVVYGAKDIRLGAIESWVIIVVSA